MRNFVKLYKLNNILLSMLLFFFCNSFIFCEPEILIEKTLIDLGKIYVHEEKLTEIVFKNIGDENLKITEIIEDCECTTLSIEKKELPPNTEGTIKINFEAGEELGETIEEIYIHTNDSKNPEINIHVRAIIIPFASVNPERIIFENLKQGEKISALINIIPTKNINALRVSKISIKNKFFTITEKSKNTNNASPIVLQFDYLGYGISNSTKDTIKIEFDLPVKTWLEIPVSISVKGDIFVEPEKIFFGRVSKDKIAEKTFFIDTQSTEPLLIKSLKSDLTEIAQIDFKTEEITKNKKYKISAQLKLIDGKIKNGFKTGKIIVETSNEKQPFIEIPVSFIFGNVENQN